MLNSIDEIKRQFIPTVQAVQFFEGEKTSKQQTSQPIYNFISQMNQSAKNGYNPFHPNVTSNNTANKLDIIS